MGVAVVGETPRLTGELIGETHGVLQYTQTYLPGNQHLKDPMCWWVAGEVTENWKRVEQVAPLPLRPLPDIQCHSAAMWVAPPW